MTMDDVLLTERDGAILHLTLNRPAHRNALDRPLGLALVRALRAAEMDDAVRVVVISGSGQAFCAGDDIGGVQAWLEHDMAPDAVAVDPNDEYSLYLRICDLITRMPKPVVAAINGVSAGAGTEIASACDLRYGAASARIGSGLVRIGHVGNAAMFAHCLGPSRATELFVTGRFMDVDEAERIGFVHAVFGDEDFASAVRDRVGLLASAPTKVIGLFKEMRDAMEGRPVGDRLRIQQQFHEWRTRPIADASEGGRAFLEKRRPRFSGR